ncbi:MAG: hypothetical protein KKD30_03860 [Gammaproteobacteria bacterium]|nr:hypothetical protein [Gammaproteobacteria bacterium]MBU0885036.1 hypothetical protein [Gammaproteobacteria bacterium]MBU1859076.1 hypothetical protein [Gammaproteobacteria bacterium]
MVLDAERQIIHYRLALAGQPALELQIHLGEAYVSAQSVPEWTRLAFQQCPHCPLKAEAQWACPFALALQQPVRLLAGHASFEAVEVQVQHRGREIRQRTTLQRAAGSLLGLLGATSGCPHTRFLEPMAWFHLPFSSSDETLFRVLGSYLLGQHLKAQKGLVVDWQLDGLREAYRNLRKVNQGMAKRLQAACNEDSSLNGLVLLDLLAADTLYSLEQSEGELDAYFAGYFDDPVP